MTTSNELTALYNKNLAALGRKPIKSGSYSKAQLKKFLEQSDAAVAALDEKKPTTLKELGEKGIKTKRRASPKKSKASADSNHTTLAEIAEELGMTPRAARIKLRNKKSPFTKDADLGWVFAPEKTKEVKRYLKG